MCHPELQLRELVGASPEYLLPVSNVARERFAVTGRTHALDVGIPGPHVSTETRDMRRNKRCAELIGGCLQ